MSKKIFNISVTKETLLLIIIIVFSFFIYWKDISRIPYGIENDEISWTATSLFHQYGIAASEKGIWGLNDAVAQRFPVSIGINQLSFVIFGKDFLSPKKMLVIIHITSLFFFYLVSRQFMSKKSALIITLLYSLSTYNLITHKIAVAPIFSQLFIYPAIFFLLTLSNKNVLRNYVSVFLAGTAISLSLLTHNLSYTFPFIGIALLCFSIYKHFSPLGIWSCLKHLFIPLIIFLIPIIFSSQIWLPGIREEAASKAYALGNVGFEIKQNRLYFSIDKINYNFSVVKKQLFNSLDPTSGDFIAYYTGPLVNKIICITFLFGLLISILRIKKYLPLLIWLFLGSFIYHIVMGLFLPRMWALTVGLIYLFAGITIDIIFHYSSRFRISKILGLILIFVLSIYIISSDLHLYYQSAVNNISYFKSRREILDLAKKYKKYLGEKVLFIASEEPSLLTKLDNVHAVVAFTYLATNPQKSEALKKMDRKRLEVLTYDEFHANTQGYIAKSDFIIIDNTILGEMEGLLNKNGCTYNKNGYKYFTYLRFKCKIIYK